MNITYLVNWSDKSIDDAKEIEAKTSKDAYLIFIEEDVYRSVAVTVWSEGEASITEDFEDHIKEAEDRESNDEDESISHSSSSENQISTLNLEQKLDEIHTTMKAIRWTIAGGFLFLILVISGIIKPGIFG